MGDLLTTTAPSPSSTATLSSQHHRRIELQSPADLTYLMNAARRAARAKLDLHLPLESAQRASDSGRDEVRAAVEERVRAYLEEVFELAKRGVSVNGIEAEGVAWEREVPDEFEPYDSALASRVQSLHARIEQLNLELAETRRSAAQAAARQFAARFDEEEGDATTGAQNDAARGAQNDAPPSAHNPNPTSTHPTNATVPPDLLNSQIPFAGREADVARAWEAGLQGLGRLRGGLGETRARGEEAVRLVEFVERGGS